MTVLHLRGVFLPDESERDAWVVDGRLTFETYRGAADTVVAAGWILPGLVDAHCHVGVALDGEHVADAEGQARQAEADRDRARCCCATPGHRSTTRACSGVRTSRG